MVKEVEISYTNENIIKCLCPTCPVQENSLCSKKKMVDMQDILQGDEDPRPPDFPGMYCANGKAECGDIETGKDCICPDCMIYQEYILENAKPDFLYCSDGKAMK